MDTKYFQQALDEYRKEFPVCLEKVSASMLSLILRRAQELKNADKAQENTHV